MTLDEILKRLDDTDVGLEDIKIVLSSLLKKRPAKPASMHASLDRDPNRKLSFELSEDGEKHDDK